MALGDTAILLSIEQLPHLLGSERGCAFSLVTSSLTAHLRLGLYDKAEAQLECLGYGLRPVKGEFSETIEILKNELKRLREEYHHGKYNLQGMLQEENRSRKPLPFTDLAHSYATNERSDLFEIRPCTVSSEHWQTFRLKNVSLSFRKMKQMLMHIRSDRTEFMRYKTSNLVLCSWPNGLLPILIRE